ncbi:MAG: hypothetical protein IPP71_02910 [Bacteroidetes bacterium]|nr:hypothetical protein [Bacteroidota bacterium]
MKPQDILILLKILSTNKKDWRQVDLAESLGLSQSEISQSLIRLRYSRFLADDGKMVMRSALLDFLLYGIAYAFPQHPGSVVRGIPTAHSAPPLNNEIVSEENFVWPSATGELRGHMIEPLYPTVPKAVKNDQRLYEFLALVDAIRIGKVREKNLLQ